MEAWTDEKEVSEQPKTGGSDWDIPLQEASKYEQPEEEVDKQMAVNLSDGSVEDYIDSDKEETEEDNVLLKETVGTTPNGKEIQVVKDPVYSGFFIQFKDGGVLPQELGGKWTTHHKAMEAVRVYIGRKLSESE